MKRVESEPGRNDSRLDEGLLWRTILAAIQQVKHGSVQIHIQDGKVVQIDTLNKMRMR